MNDAGRGARVRGRELIRSTPYISLRCWYEGYEIIIQNALYSVVLALPPWNESGLAPT